MLFFKKKKEKEAALGKGFVPKDRARDLSSKGFTEPEIINALRKEGFSAGEIDKGLMQGLRDGVAEVKTEPAPAVEQKPGLPTLEEITKAQKPQMPAVPETSLPEEYYYPDTYETEEYVQTLVKERVQDIEEKLGNFSVKYGELDSRIQQIYNQLSLLTKKKPSEEQLLSTKLDALKDTVDDISTRLNSLERAFKETLPALIESVRALSDLVQRLKKEA